MPDSVDEDLDAIAGVKDPAPIRALVAQKIAELHSMGEEYPVYTDYDVPQTQHPRKSALIGWKVSWSYRPKRLGLFRREQQYRWSAWNSGVSDSKVLRGWAGDKSSVEYRARDAIGKHLEQLAAEATKTGRIDL